MSMNERRAGQNEFQEKIEFDPKNPETWQKGDIVDLGPLDEFDRYREEIVVRALQETINELVRREGLDLFAPRHLKFMETGERVIKASKGLAEKVRPHSDISDSLLDLIDVAFEKGRWQQEIKKIGHAFSFDDFIKLMKTNTVDTAEHTRPKGVTEYLQPYKDAYILLTGDNRHVEKLSVGGFTTVDSAEQNKILKYIYIRQEAFSILEKEEREGRAEGLVNEIIEHEYAEIEHFMNSAEVETPHKLDRDKKYLEVLKVLRKRKYFH